MWTLTVIGSLILIALFTEMNKRNRADTVGHDWLWCKVGLILTISFCLSYKDMYHSLYISRNIPPECGLGSVVSMATAYGLDGPGIESR
jgi:hypothetical protein